VNKRKSRRFRSGSRFLDADCLILTFIFFIDIIIDVRSRRPQRQPQQRPRRKREILNQIFSSWKFQELFNAKIVYKVVFLPDLLYFLSGQIAEVA
jgi:hypothetical protein